MDATFTVQFLCTNQMNYNLAKMDVIQTGSYAIGMNASIASGPIFYIVKSCGDPSQSQNCLLNITFCSAYSFNLLVTAVLLVSH